MGLFGVGLLGVSADRGLDPPAPLHVP